MLRPLREIFAGEDRPDLLAGLDDPDDAGVWRLDAEKAVVLTADFFPPVVDDPRAYGAIAAANALSDIYAMGAAPLMAINLVGFPEALGTDLLAEILRGGAEKVREAGAVVAGGHTTSDREPKYGLAVLGLVHPQRIWTKGGARDGDVLFLTKPLGTGLVTTALKTGEAEATHVEEAVRSMSRLNRRAAELLAPWSRDLHAVTDVTGFGLAGHAHEMAHQSGLTLRFAWNALPHLPGALDYAAGGHVPGGGRRNEGYFGRWARNEAEPPPGLAALPWDPQTSGGLLFAVGAGLAVEITETFRRSGEPLWRVGEACAGDPGAIRFA